MQNDSASAQRLQKFQDARRPMKSIDAPLVVTDPEPPADHFAAHQAWQERKQRAEFSHFVKALHARGPDETWDPRTSSVASYRNHG